MKSYSIQHDFLYVGLNVKNAKAYKAAPPAKKVYSKSTPVRLSLLLSPGAEELMKAYAQQGLPIMLLDDISVEENEVLFAYKQVLITGIVDWFSHHGIYTFVRN